MTVDSIIENRDRISLSMDFKANFDLTFHKIITIKKSITHPPTIPNAIIQNSIRRLLCPIPSAATNVSIWNRIVEKINADYIGTNILKSQNQILLFCLVGTLICLVGTLTPLVGTAFPHVPAYFNHWLSIQLDQNLRCVVCLHG